MNFIEALLQSAPGGARELRRARLRVAVSEALLLAMQQQGLSKAEMARRVGQSRSAVTQALAGTRNLSLNTLADMAHAAGLQAKVSFERQGLVRRAVTGASIVAGTTATLVHTAQATRGSHDVEFNC